MRPDLRPVLDLAGLQLLHAVEAPAFDHDYHALPADPVEEKVPQLGGVEHAGSRVHRHVALLDGEPAGTVTLDLPTRDNLSVANLDVIVHPALRRRGLGRWLLDWGIAEAQRLDRSRIWLQVPGPLDGTAPGERLMREIGAKPALDECRRLLDLHSTALLDPSPVAAGYRMEQWVDRTPDELVDDVAYLNGRMSTDAPLGDMTMEPEVWDADRVREKEALGRATNRLHLLTAAVHEATGDVAGLTAISVSRSRPVVGYQWETIVDPAHRGHRLGLALKTWNHHQLADRSPGTRYVNTWNADSNSFMVSVNELCGFRLMERWTEYQLDLPA
jgi:GNAT superfamily N-acetyltransferase